MTLIKRVAAVVIIFLVAHIIPVLSRLVYSSFNLTEISNRPVQEIRYVTICYTLQILFTVVALKIMVRDKGLKGGFNLKNSSLSIKILKKFIIVWIIIVVSFFIIALSFIPGFYNYVLSICPQNFWNIIKDFIGSVIFAGIGEEPLFRSLVILTLVKYWTGSFKIGKFTIPYVAFISGFIFMTAHIGYNVYPHFEITHIDQLQLTFTFILGVFWATVFVKTKSLLCPILAHSSANAIQYAIGYIISFLHP